MTAPQQQQPPPVDPGNPYVLAGEYPAIMTLTGINTPVGQRLLLTIRCGPATLTVLLNRDDAKAWAAQLDSAASSMSGLIIAGPGQIRAGFPPPPNGQRR